MAKNGKAITAEEARINFGKIKLAPAYPDLLEIQIKSFM